MDSDSEISCDRVPFDYLSSDDSDTDHFSEDWDLLRPHFGTGQDEAKENERYVNMYKLSRKRKRRAKKWEKHEPMECRPTADCVRSHLYRLPIELFTMVMDYLDFRDILYLCQDPEFPLHFLLRRHLLLDKSSSYSIVHQALSDDWSIIPAIKKFMQILVAQNEFEPSDLPLREAIVYERVDLCKVFIEAGAKLTAPVRVEPYEPVSDLFRNQGLDNMDHFIRYEAKFYWRPSDRDFAPLHLATIIDNLEIVDLLLQHGADPNAVAGHYGTPLHLTKDHKIAQLLISKGADVNACNGAGSTPLFTAIGTRREALASQLLKAGADANMHNQDGLSPLLIACNIGRPYLIYQLIGAGCDVQGLPSDSPLHVAVLNGHANIAQFLLGRGANVNHQNEYGTALHVAKCGKVAEILLAYGADVDAKNADGYTPLQLNIIRHNTEMFNVLLTAGADWTSPNIDWDDFIYEAVYTGKYSTVRLLLTHCKIKISKDNYLNPIPCAIEHGHEGIARLLIENDPDLVNQADDKGITPISAAMQWRPTLVAELLAAGALPTDSDLDFDSDTDPSNDSDSDVLESREDLRAAVAQALKDQDMDKVNVLMDSWKKTYT